MMEKSKENGRNVIPDLQRKNYICDKERLTEILFLVMRFKRMIQSDLQ